MAGANAARKGKASFRLYLDATDELPAPAAASPAGPASTREITNPERFKKAANDVPEWKELKEKMASGKKLKFKKPNPKQTMPGNWKDNKIVGMTSPQTCTFGIWLTVHFQEQMIQRKTIARHHLLPHLLTLP